MTAARPLVGADRAALILQLVPYLIGKGEVSLTEAADEFDVTPAQMRSMVEKLTVIGLPGALTAGEYEALGVGRISYGPTTQRVALTALQDVASSLYADGAIPPSTRALN